MTRLKSETHSGIVVIAGAWLIFYCALAGHGLVHSHDGDWDRAARRRQVSLWLRPERRTALQCRQHPPKPAIVGFGRGTGIAWAVEKDAAPVLVRRRGSWRSAAGRTSRTFCRL